MESLPLNRAVGYGMFSNSDDLNLVDRSTDRSNESFVNGRNSASAGRTRNGRHSLARQFFAARAITQSEKGLGPGNSIGISKGETNCSVRRYRPCHHGCGSAF